MITFVIIFVVVDVNKFKKAEAEEENSVGSNDKDEEIKETV